MEAVQAPRPYDPLTFLIMEGLDWHERLRTVGTLCKSWRGVCGTAEYYHWCCRRLNIEARVYAPPRPPPKMSWAHIFNELWPRRKLWEATTPSKEAHAGSEKDKSVVAELMEADEALLARQLAAAAAAAAEGQGRIVDLDDDVSSSSKYRGGDDEVAARDESSTGNIQSSLKHAEPRDGDDASSSISVTVRFRPEIQRAADVDERKDATEKPFVLPLHQRLQMIRQKQRRERGEKGKRGEALAELNKDGLWFNNNWKKEKTYEPKSTTSAWSSDFDEMQGSADVSEATPSSSGSSSMASQQAHIHNVDPLEARVVAVAPGIGLREFQFDHVLPKQSGQAAVFEASTRRLLTDFLNGTNATIIVYGQTGSGKTFTMFGPQALVAPETIAGKSGISISCTPTTATVTNGNETVQVSPNSSTAAMAASAAVAQSEKTRMGSRNALLNEEENTIPETGELMAKAKLEKNAVVDSGKPMSTRQNVHALRGIVPRAADEILAAVAHKQRQGLRASVLVSYVEVFGDEVSDLLQEGRRCGHSKVAAQNYVLRGSANIAVGSVDEVNSLLEKGDRVKRKAATAMNERSSRAHALFIFTLEQYEPALDRKVTSSLFLVDLGGSEKVKKSRVTAGEMSDHHGLILGEQMREAIHINLGLLSLKECVDAINKGHSYVPFQNSKLTMLLSPALGGESKASVVVCGSMQRSDATETVQALRFGEACSRVDTSAASTGVLGAAGLLEALDREIVQLEEVIRRKERWEMSETMRRDTLMEDGSYEAAMAAKVGGEVVKTGRVVGAEAERERLEGLLVRRCELLGEDVTFVLAQAGFGGLYGAKAEDLKGNAESRFEQKSKEGLKIKGKAVADWNP